MNEHGSESGVLSDTLDSWKAIAGYLNRGVRTVRRWELVRGLPVHRVPGGGKPGVYALKSELDGWWKGTRALAEGNGQAGPRLRPPSVAVLPFSNLTADKEHEYFSDGLADEIITALTHVQGLRVAARTSSFAFRGKEQDVRKIGAALGVSTLLEGSVQTSGGRIRVSAQLVNASDGFHLWSHRFDRQPADVFAIQDEISRAVAAALEVQLRASGATRRTANLDAYNHWLKGRYYQQYEDLEALTKCRTYFERAIALDPSFAQPYLGIAELCRAAAEFGTGRPTELGTQGRVAIQRALELDDCLGEAYALRGTYRAWLDYDWPGAEADFQRARVLAPASAALHSLRALNCLVPVGRLPEAEEEMNRAVELDPVSPFACTFLGKVLLWQRRYADAQVKIEAALELRPDYGLGHWYRGVALWFQGRTQEAVAVWESAMRKIGPNAAMMGAIGMALGYLGRHAEARSILAELEAASRQRYVTGIACAQIHMSLGNVEATFEWLDRAVEERDPHILDLPCKPIWDGLREDRRFAALLRKMRLC